MPQITTVSVTQQGGAHLVVQTAATADVVEVPGDTGIIVNAPLHDQNGGPVTGPHGPGNMYRITGDEGAVHRNYANLRYLHQTPGGNAQYTTE